MQTIYLDISNKGVVPTVYAKQGDVGRKFQVVLTDSGLPYVPVGGSAFSVWYSGASGEGNYTDIDENSAFSVNGNKVTVEMIAQMLSNDGEGTLSLVLNDNGGNQIGLWNIRYVCEPVPGANSEEAEIYYTAFSESVGRLSNTDAIVRNKLSVDGSNTMESDLPMGGHRVTGMREPVAVGDAVNLGALNTAVKKAAPRNLLDNSDFRNPVNQRGYVSGTVGEANYTIDRWKTEYDTYLHLHSGYVGMSGFWVLSQLVGCKMFAGKTYTFSVEAKSEAANGNMFMRLGDPTGTGAKEYRQAVNSNIWSKCVWTWTADRDYEPGECDFSFGINSGNELTTQIYYKNPAVYEGEYTTETLPEYQPKGYGAELAECRRYYQRYGGETYTKFGFGVAISASNARILMPILPMRITKPSCNIFGVFALDPGENVFEVNQINLDEVSYGGLYACLLVSIIGEQLITRNTVLLQSYNSASSYIELSADL